MLTYSSVRRSGLILLESAPAGLDLSDVQHDLEKVRASFQRFHNKANRLPGPRCPLHPRTTHLAPQPAENSRISACCRLRLLSRPLPKDSQDDQPVLPRIRDTFGYIAARSAIGDGHIVSDSRRENAPLPDGLWNTV